jgi:hypothetical protein
MEHVETADAPVRPATRPARSGRSARDMALSMAVLIIPIFLLLGAAQTYATARHSASFPVLEPGGLPGGWTAISATFGKVDDGSTLRVSYVPPAKTGLQLVESDRPVNALLPDELGGAAQPGNLETVGGRQWRTYPVAGDGGRALVLAEDGRTTIITGTASAADLRTFAATLH